jgi:hypothetical protein
VVALAALVGGTAVAQMGQGPRGPMAPEQMGQMMEMMIQMQEQMKQMQEQMKGLQGPMQGMMTQHQEMMKQFCPAAAGGQLPKQGG